MATDNASLYSRPLRNTEAWRMGYRDFQRGRSINQGPYAMPRAASDWELGWNDAYADFQDREPGQIR